MKALLLAMLWAVACLAQVVPGVVERVTRDAIHLRGGREFIIDGKTAIYGQLTRGSLVRVRHEGSHARVIAVRTTFKGEISELRHEQWFVVGGRTVYLLRDTRFGTSARQLHLGQTVEASGWPNAKGDLEAEQVILYNTDVPAQLP